MNLILLFPDDLVPGTARVILTGRRHVHVLEVHRAREGDILIVGMENGKVGRGRVMRLTAKELEMDVTFDAPPPSKIPVILAIALMRPVVLKRVLHTAASMGVEEIHLFHSRRVEKSFWQSTALSFREVREQLVLGLEQARDTIMPPVIMHKRFKPFVEDCLPGLLKGRLGLLADPSGGSSIQLSSTPKILIIGPEGGFIPYELESFQEAGCSLISLGPRILRVETALPALLSRIS